MTAFAPNRKLSSTVDTAEECQKQSFETETATTTEIRHRNVP